VRACRRETLRTFVTQSLLITVKVFRIDEVSQIQMGNDRLRNRIFTINNSVVQWAIPIVSLLCVELHFIKKFTYYSENI